MDAKDEEFMNRLKGMFIIEAEEHLRAITVGLLELEKSLSPERYTEIIEIVFRETHSLKGAARSVGIKEIESLCQPLESAFAALKRQEIIISPELLNLFHKGIDTIMSLISTSADEVMIDKTNIKELIPQLKKILITDESNENVHGQQLVEVSSTVKTTTGDPYSSVPVPSLESSTETAQLSSFIPVNEAALAARVNEKAISASTIRIPVVRLDALMLQAEEFTQIKNIASQQIIAMREIYETVILWKKDFSHLNEYKQLNEMRFNTLENQLETMIKTLEGDQRAIKRMVNEHMDAMKQILMLPAAALAEVFPKIVHDLSHDQGKEVELVMQGTEIEIDKRILDELKDPLIHLLRNCIDHGINKPAERISHQKSPRGKIAVSFSTTDNRQVEIAISDDGIGIDIEKVKEAAIKAKILSRDDARSLNPQDIVSLVFQSGISTSSMITDISGRGLGLAIVQEKVEKLGGVAAIETMPHVGTTFRITLPLTLATFQGVLVKVNEDIFVLPTLNVVKVVRINKNTIQTVEGRNTISLDGRILSLVKLSDTLGLSFHKINPSKSAIISDDMSDCCYILILASANKRMAFEVDEVLNEQQVMVKSLGKQLRHVQNIAGATISGNGKLVPVLNVAELLISALSAVASANMETNVPISRKERLLVAEDSITARTLLKNILETAGYEVATAVDGMDAFTQLRSSVFDLVVSDVDMPRMSGFELTSKIRSDNKLAEIPVVLVTALDSREDRERGIDAGANAYIVKSSFDQSNLLEVIKQLI